MTFNPAPAAATLAETMNAAARIADFAPDQKPGDLAQGYDVQDYLAAHQAADGTLQDSLAGWKLGLGSINAMKGAGLARPVIGRVFKGRLFEDGADVPAPAGSVGMIEIEIAFTLSRDVAPGDSITNPRDMIASANLVSEIVLSRFVDRTTVGLPSFVADSVGFHALVIGPQVSLDDVPAIASSVTVDSNGERAVGAQQGDDAIDPFEMMTYLMAHTAERGLSLKAGEIVTTGSISKPFDADVPAKIVAETSGGAVSYSLTEQ
ncbi:MAG: fumarylacetoacetate hydrolase family protein [Pseudomonadota bacterium]